MPQFPEEYVAEGWVEADVADTDHLLVNNNAVEAKDVARYMQGIRVITGDATLAATDRIVIIDSADPTISLTLDAGSATRGRCEILWSGEPSDPRTLTLVRAGGTGTIDGVSSSKVVTGRMKLGVYATGAGEWFTDAGETTQTVTSSPATVAARFIVLDDDGHTSGSPGSLVMPPITAGAVHIINTPYEDVHYVISQDPGDPVNTGPDYQVNSQFVRQQMIVIFAAESEGQLRWQYDATAEYVSSAFVYLFQLADQILALERPYSLARTRTETSAAYTWSDGGAVKRLVINRTGSQCAVTLDESDWEDGETGRLDCYNTDNLGVQIIVGGGAVLNGRTAGLGYATLPGSDLVGGMPPCFEVTRIDGGWTIRPMVDFGPRLDDIESVLGPLSSTTVPALDTRIDALEVTGRQVITTSTATILPGTRVVYIDHAAARTDLTLPATPFEPFTIVKRATSGSFGVRLIPNAGTDAVQGLAAGTNFDIGWLTTNASTTTARPAAFVSSSVVNVVDVA